MSDAENPVVEELRSLQAEDALVAFSVFTEAGSAPRIWLNWVGSPHDKLREFIEAYRRDYEIREEGNKERYLFFNDEIRPGSGLIRVFGGKPQGPGGTLTCLLTSRDGEDNYLVAAGHVLTDFWRDNDGLGSIYRYRKGFPSTGSRRFLGKTLYHPENLPRPIPKGDPVSKDWQRATMDVGVIKLEVDPEEIDLKQRTTCFGGFGEVYIAAEDKMKVVKCGSQETHWTEARVLTPKMTEVKILGPDGTLYLFKDQIILRDLKPLEAKKAKCPTNPPDTPFAVPGDSGTIVVEKKSKRPIGMLIAGSVLDGRYVVTPFKPIEDFFEGIGLVRMRA